MLKNQMGIKSRYRWHGAGITSQPLPDLVNQDAERALVLAISNVAKSARRIAVG